MIRTKSWLLASVIAVGAAVGATAKADEINLYSARHYDTDLALYENFTAETGITVNLIEGKADELVARIQSEGARSPADILLTVDAGRLWRADQLGLFQPANSDVLDERIPAKLRHADGHWYGFSKRARIIAYSKERGLPAGIETYEDLASPAAAGKICIRSSSNIYNISLMASILEEVGPEAAEAWAEGVVANFARQPEGNDTAQLMSVIAGACDIAVSNSYYVGRLIGSDDAERRAAGEAIGILFPNQDGRGTHVNLSGGGILATAPNPDGARLFLEYLTTEAAQMMFAEGNNEYPVVAGIAPPATLTSFGDFIEDDVSTEVYGERAAEAVQVYDRAGWK